MQAILIAVLIFASVNVHAAHSADFVKSSAVFPAADVSKFQVAFDGGAFVDSTPFAFGGGVIVKHTLAGQSHGAHTVKARVCNISGCGTESPVLNFIIGPGVVNWTGTLIIGQ